MIVISTVSWAAIKKKRKKTGILYDDRLKSLTLRVISNYLLTCLGKQRWWHRYLDPAIHVRFRWGSSLALTWPSTFHYRCLRSFFLYHLIKIKQIKSFYIFIFKGKTNSYFILSTIFNRECIFSEKNKLLNKVIENLNLTYAIFWVSNFTFWNYSSTICDSDSKDYAFPYLIPYDYPKAEQQCAYMSKLLIL